MSMGDFYIGESPKRSGLIHHANMVTYWVVSNIVSEMDMSLRVRMLRKCILLAKYLQVCPLGPQQCILLVVRALSFETIMASWPL